MYKNTMLVTFCSVVLAACNASDNNSLQAGEATGQQEKTAVIETPTTPVHDEATIKQLLDSVNPNYDATRQCWVTPSEHEPGNHYCLKIADQKTVAVDNGKSERVYLVLAGELLDNDTKEPSAAHVSSGLASFVVLQDKQIMFSAPNVLIGSWGQPPENWSLEKLSANDDWGWATDFGDCHFGHCGSYYLLYAPHKDKLAELASFPMNYSNGGTIEAEEGKATELNADITFVESESGFYNMNVTISGTQAGQPIETNTWTLAFDENQRVYQEPADWPMKDVEF